MNRRTFLAAVGAALTAPVLTKLATKPEPSMWLFSGDVLSPEQARRLIDVTTHMDDQHIFIPALSGPGAHK